MPSPSRFIAIVEDDPSIRISIARLLRTSGFRVQTFASAEQYLEEADSAMVACVLIDIQLGAGLSGITLAEMISIAPRRSPFVLMSASPSPADVVRARELGGHEVLLKPFSISTLVAAIAAAVAADEAPPPSL
jgi:DNA-binding response OmpR family regulator